MTLLLSIGLANALAAVVLAVPAYLVGRYGRRPALAHALWLLVLLKLVTPPLFRVDLPWLPAERPDEPVIATAPEPTPVITQLPEELFLFPQDTRVDVRAPALDLARLTVPVVARLAPPPAPAREPAAVEPAPAGNEPTKAKDRDVGELFPLLLIVWTVGAILVVGRAAFLVWRFQRLLASARPAGVEVQEQAAALARQMGMAGCPRVWLVPGPLPPMVWALGRARVLFPAGLLDRLDGEARASLLAHELAHVRRRDHWVRWLELVVLGLYWWYPLAWVARRQLQAREEECCDAWAAGQVAPRVYANAILDAVDFLAEARPRVPAVASPLAGTQSLRERLTLIMAGGASGRLGWLGRLALLALAVATLPLLPSLTRRAESAAPPTPRPEAVKLVLETTPAEPTAFANQGVNLVGGSDEVFSVAISPDNKYIAAGMGNAQRPGRLQLWDFETRKSLLSRDTPYGVSSVAFSTDSKALAWAGWNGLARVDQLSPFRRLFTPRLEGNNRFAYSGDGKWLAAAGENRLVQLLDSKTGRPVARFTTAESLAYYCLTFSTNSKLLATGGGSFQQGGVRAVPPAPAAAELRAIGRGTGGPNLVHLFDVATRKPVGKLEGHSLAVINVAFAPRDALIATASADSTVRLYDGKTFKFRTTLKGHTDAVKGLAFSPDGKTLATGSWDRSIRLWDPVKGKELAKLDGHPAAVREIAFSRDGKYLVSGGALRTVKLWDVLKRKEVATLRQDAAALPPAPPALTLAVSGDGKLLATGTEDGKIVLRDAKSGEVVKTLAGHEDAVTALAFSRDGKRLASSGPDMLVKIWDVSAGKAVHTLKGHTSWVYSLAFSGDGKTLASGSYDRSIRLWNAEKGGDAAVLNGHKASVRGLAFAPGDALLASAGSDKSVRLWDVKERKSLGVLKGHPDAVRAVAFSRDGKTLFSACEDGAVKRWDVKEQKELNSVKGHEGEATCLALSPGGATLVSGGRDGYLRFWSGSLAARGLRFAHQEGTLGVGFAPDGQTVYSLGAGRVIRAYHAAPGPIRLFEGHTGPVRVATYSPDGKYLLSCGGWPEGDRTLRLWDAKTGKQVRVLTTAKVHLQSAAFTPDGKHAVTGGDDGVITMFDVDSGKEVRRFTGHGQGAIPSLSFSKDGKWLLSSGHDKTVRLWDVKSGKEERVFTGHEEWARCAVFLPDGKHILSGGRDRVARLWDLGSGKLVKTIDHNKEWVESLAVLPDGKRVLTGGGNSMRLIELESGKVLRTYAGHSFGVTSVAAAKDGRTALTTSYDGSARLWDVEAGAELQRFSHHRNWVWGVSIAPDGKTFVTAGGGGQRGSEWIAGDDFDLRLWRMPEVR